ncbi:FKBP-type peptidyl-prolyl cis-trans isomerase [Microbacterium sp. NPDC057407]|uniref:FKBP-type peptidyl-prolyl cis-trans isomerase n=1 Tax=Microbacterium sp. NPDC057407 TaxID=3346120 RepID=UPI003670FA3D
MRTRAAAALFVATAALAAGLLTGCTPSAAESELQVPTPVDLCAAAAPAGPASDAVAVAGEVGSPATVTLASPLSITGTERTVVVEGDGPEVDASSLVSYAMTVYDPATGAAVQSQGYDDAATLPVPAASLGQYIGCAPVGSRVVVTVPASDADAASVRVFDVLDTRPGVATGEQQSPVDGMPSVELSDGGAPTVTIPGAEPPAETRIAVLKKGDGDRIEPGDTVMLHYSGVRWSDGTVFDSSWAQGAPTVLTTSNVIDGYREALEGQTVGSQVLAVIPPGAAYGEGSINEDDLVGETLVFVIDILATTPAP